MQTTNELPKETEWNIIKFMSHPIADALKKGLEEKELNIIKIMHHPIAEAFKKGLEEELEDHFRVFKEGPCYESNWCYDDDWSFAHEHFRHKLYMDIILSDQFMDIYTNINAPWMTHRL